MKKLLAILVALLLISLVGCGEEAQTDSTTTTADTTQSADITTMTTETTGDTTTTETPAATTTATKTPTPDKTEKPTTPVTTTNVSYSTFKSHDWLFRVIVEDEGNQFCRTYTVVLNDGELRIGESSSSPYEEMVPPEYRDQEKPDFEFGGIQWYTGAGGYVPLSSAKENANTITLTDADGKQLVLTRTGETTAKVVSNTIDIHTKAGDVFTVTK